MAPLRNNKLFKHSSDSDKYTCAQNGKYSFVNSHLYDIHGHIMPETITTIDQSNGKPPAPATLAHYHHWLSDKQQ